MNQDGEDDQNYCLFEILHGLYINLKISDFKNIYKKIQDSFELPDSIKNVIENTDKINSSEIESFFSNLKSVEGFKDSKIIKDLIYQYTVPSLAYDKLIKRLNQVESNYIKLSRELMNSNKTLEVTMDMVDILSKQVMSNPNTSDNSSAELDDLISNFHQIKANHFNKHYPKETTSSLSPQISTRKDSSDSQYSQCSQSLSPKESRRPSSYSAVTDLSSDENFGTTKEEEFVSKLKTIWDLSPSDSPDLDTQSTESINGIKINDEAYINPHNYKNSTYFSTDLIPRNTQESYCDDVINNILDMIRPNSSQIKFRMKIKKFLSKLIRNSLNTHVFETGFFFLRNFLPDDPLKLSIYLNKQSFESNWSQLLSDKIVKVCDGNEEANFNNEDMNENDMEYDESILNSINELNCVQYKEDYKVVFYVESVLVEIHANDRQDLCFMAFLEEIDELIGKSHLFKRSLTLIRSWWIYESPSYLGTSNLGNITDEVFCTLVCAIFNQYHQAITYPLQALCIFLAEYSSFDWDKFAVSIHGAVPIPLNQTGIQTGSIQSAAYSPAQLLDAKFLRKHREMYHTTELIDKIDFNSIRFNFNSDDKNVGKNIPDRSSDCFRVRSINILHPLHPNLNMITNMVNPKKKQQFIRVLEIGAKNVSSSLKLVKEGVVSVQTCIRNSFQNIVNRFGTGWKPDVSFLETNSSSSSSSNQRALTDNNDDSNYELMNASLSDLLDGLNYGNMLIEGQVTESGFRILFKDFLYERGALPVGEIGKMLQDSTGITTLSTSLKLKFGGLKKFLEKYPEEFVIGVNHPFNPHVYLKETLSKDDIEAISRGEIPRSVLLKLKKSQKEVSRKKKPPTSQSPSPESFSTTTNNLNSTNSNHSVLRRSIPPINRLRNTPFNPNVVSAKAPSITGSNSFNPNYSYLIHSHTQNNPGLSHGNMYSPPPQQQQQQQQQYHSGGNQSKSVFSSHFSYYHDSNNSNNNNINIGSNNNKLIDPNYNKSSLVSQPRRQSYPLKTNEFISEIETRRNLSMDSLNENNNFENFSSSTNFSSHDFNNPSSQDSNMDMNNMNNWTNDFHLNSSSNDSFLEKILSKFDS